MLRADAFALTASDTFRSLTASLCNPLILLHVRCMISPIATILIIESEVLWNCNLHWTARSTVAASCTWNGNSRINHISHCMHSRNLKLIQRLKVLHIVGIIQKLLHIRHARQHHLHLRERCCKSNRPGRNTHICIQIAKHLLCIVRNFGQGTALHRLHNNNRLIVFHTYFVVQARLDFLRLPVQIIDLQLDEFHLRVTS